jgi:hypothetical protein
MKPRVQTPVPPIKKKRERERETLVKRVGREVQAELRPRLYCRSMQGLAIAGNHHLPDGEA